MRFGSLSARLWSPPKAGAMSSASHTTGIMPQAYRIRFCFDSLSCLTVWVSTEKLRTASTNVGSAMNQIDKKANSIYNTINGLSGATWDANSQKKVMKKLAVMKKDIATMKKMLNEQTTELLTFAQKYESAESSNVSQVSNLSSSQVVQIR